MRRTVRARSGRVAAAEGSQFAPLEPGRADSLPAAARRTVEPCEPHHRHRRPAQRRQVDPLQRPDQERRARGELPVRHHRAERRRRRRAGPAARRRWPRSSARPSSCPATVSFVDIAGIVRGASEGEGLGNKFLANIREADAICQVIRAFRDADVVHVDGEVVAEERHRDDQHRADPRRPADHREGAAAAGEGVAARQGQEQVARRLAAVTAAQERAAEGHHAVRRCSRGRHRPRRPARAAPADRQAVPLRVQRRRGRAGRRGVQGRAARRWSRRPRRSSWTPRSRPS